MKLKHSLFFLLCMIISVSSISGPRSGFTTVTEMRPYYTGDVYLTIAVKGLCSTNVFRISSSASGKEEMYSALLASMMNSTKVSLEVVSCTGWGSILRSVYIQP